MKTCHCGPKQVNITRHIYNKKRTNHFIMAHLLKMFQVFIMHFCVLAPVWLLIFKNKGEQSGNQAYLCFKHIFPPQIRHPHTVRQWEKFSCFILDAMAF